MRDIDPRCPWVTLTPCNVFPRWELKTLVYQDENQSGGNHNIYITVLDERGAPVSGVICWQKWPDAQPQETQQATLGGVTNFGIWGGPFYPDRGEAGAYWSFVESTAKSDVVNGMGLPANRHVNYILTFQRVVADAPIPPTPNGWTEAQIRAFARDEISKSRIIPA